MAWLGSGFGFGFSAQGCGVRVRVSVTVRAGLDRCNLALEVLSAPCATEEAGEPLDWLLVRGR